MSRRLIPLDLVAVIAIGGALGAIARYELAKSIHSSATGWPWGTFVVNISGAFVVGVLATKLRGRVMRAFVAVGMIGAYTTFSTLATETMLLIKHDRIGLGVAYLVASMALGIGAAALGTNI